MLSANFSRPKPMTSRLGAVPEPPRISVVVTCYNLGRFLDEAIDSVLAQTYNDFDILIVDDGSTDRATIDLLAGYNRPKCSVVRIDNRGLPGARNEGIRRTSGQYVCCLDADDRLHPAYFEKAAAILDSDVEVAFVSHWLRTFGDEEKDWTPRSADFPDLLDMNSINGAALVRREALLAVGLFDETMRYGCEDWDLWIAMVEQGLRGKILPEVLFYYRRRADSMSRLMMEGDRHVALYRYLVGKHRPSFEAHLPHLLARREADEAAMIAETRDLECDCDDMLTPEIDRLREAIRVGSRKLERIAQEQSLKQQLRQLADELDRSAGVILEAERRAAHDHAELTALRSTVETLYHSVSWRITQPLRAVYSLLQKRERP